MIFTFKDKITVLTDKRINKPLIKSLFENFCKKSCEVDFRDGEENTFRFGTGMTPDLDDDREYSLLIDEYGFVVRSHGTSGLTRGIMALLMQIHYHSEDGENVYFTAAPCNVQSHYRIKQRMLHLCVFPETDKLFLHKIIRLAGVLQYTHIILEFWGTLKYDCMPELAWKEKSMTKAEAKEFIDEIRAFGMEPVPMFNQLGHASQSRESYGKHTVLDQDPRLQFLFTPDGWSWDVRNKKTKTLLRNIRKELYELFGEGEYIHIGCDEAYNYANDAELNDLLPEWLSELTADVISEGRKPLMWMDMLLPKKFENCTCNARSEKDAERLFKSLANGTVACDWQYGCTSAPVPTSAFIKNKGIDVIGCSWLDKWNIEAMEETVFRNGLSGMMVTTWDSISRNIKGLLFAAKAWNSVLPSDVIGKPQCTVATLLRNVMLEEYGYDNAGFMKKQIET